MKLVFTCFLTVFISSFQVHFSVILNNNFPENFPGGRGVNCGVSLWRRDSIQETTSVVKRNSLVAGHGYSRLTGHGNSGIAVNGFSSMSSIFLIGAKPFADVLKTVVILDFSIIAVEVKVHPLPLPGFIRERRSVPVPIHEA